MNNESGYSAVIAKVRAVYGKRVTTQEYEALVHKKTVAQVVSALGQTGRYQGVFQGVNEAQAHRGQIEMLLGKALFETYVRLSRFIPVGFGGFRSFYIWKSELDVILNTIQFIHVRQYDAIVAYLPAYLTPYASFDLMSLGTARSFEDLLRLLEGTRYSRMLKNLLPGAYAPVGEHFDFESVSTQLYEEYYRWAFECIGSDFKVDDRKELSDSIHRQMTLEDMLAAYRMRSFFDRPPEEVKLFLQPSVGHRLRREIGEAIQGDDAGEKLLKLMDKTYFRGRLAYDEKNLEVALRRDAYHYHRKMLRMTQSGTAALYALVKLLEIERQNITTIIEGTKYALPPAEIESMLVY